MVLCTDGLHDLVSPEEIRAAFAESRDPSKACDDLVSLARSHGGHDNITIAACVVTELDMLEPWPAQEEAPRGSEP